MATTVVPATIDKQLVRDAIDALIERATVRMTQVQQDDELVAQLGFAIDTLIELEHNLRLCSCPDEAYEKAGQA